MAHAGVRGEGLRWPSAGFRREPVFFFPGFVGAGLKPGATFTSTPKRIEVRFWERLRDEKKFSGPEELRAQISRDIEAADKFFSRLRRFRSIRQPVPSRSA